MNDAPQQDERRTVCAAKWSDSGQGDPWKNTRYLAAASTFNSRGRPHMSPLRTCVCVCGVATKMKLSMQEQWHRSGVRLLCPGYGMMALLLVDDESVGSIRGPFFRTWPTSEKRKIQFTSGANPLRRHCLFSLCAKVLSSLSQSAPSANNTKGSRSCQFVCVIASLWSNSVSQGRNFYGRYGLYMSPLNYAQHRHLCGAPLQTYDHKTMRHLSVSRTGHSSLGFQLRG